MSNEGLKAIVKGKPSRGNDLAHILMAPSTIAQIKAALPAHMRADRMARIALTEIRKTPKLAQCEPRSFLGALMELSRLGLEPGGPLGHAYLIPFENAKRKSVDVQLIIGYRGMLDLARRSGLIQTVQAQVVREGDTFEMSLGQYPTLVHKPAWDDDQPMTHVYAVATFVDGGRPFEVMSRGQIEKIRRQSRSGSEGPWVSHFEEMARKTVIRRLFKYLPVSIELQRAVAIDERGDAGVDQLLDENALEGSASEIREESTPAPEPRQAGNTGIIPPDMQKAVARHAATDSAGEIIDPDTGELFGKPNGKREARQLTYAEIAETIQIATTAEQYENVADLIRSVPNAKQRAELQGELEAKRKQ